MKDKVKTILDFTSDKIFDIKEDIIRDLRFYLNNPQKDINDFIKDVKEQMLILDFLENYEMTDRVYDWCYEYYGEDNNDEENE